MNSTGTPLLIPLGIFTLTVQFIIFFGTAKDTPGWDGKHHTVWHDKSVDSLTRAEYKHDKAFLKKLRRGLNSTSRFGEYNVAGEFRYGDNKDCLQVRILCAFERPAGYIVESVDGKTIAFVEKYKIDAVVALTMADPRRPRMTRSQVRPFLV
ncbi:predicted protein [Chaetoceros tenuissimus]|uniref:Uncharacterized protein n=1 Tax=Chaetoceros tenuissimus TaxID=426638 RepID=A0AAD3CUE4_9STRA|nr:predicted protein [Chaetoceros tenuissimus]